MTKQAQPVKKGSSVRLMPAVMVTVAAVLGLKAVAMAESVAETVAEAGHDQPAAAAAGGHGEEGAEPLANTAQCTAPSLAEMAGLSQAEVQVLQALGTRRAELDARGDAMETQDGLMLAAEQRLSERLAELRTLETHVNDLLGQLDAAQEERFTRKKHDPGFPNHSIEYCLRQAKLKLTDIDAVVFYILHLDVVDP